MFEKEKGVNMTCITFQNTFIYLGRYNDDLNITCSNIEQLSKGYTCETDDALLHPNVNVVSSICQLQLHKNGAVLNFNLYLSVDSSNRFTQSKIKFLTVSIRRMKKDRNLISPRSFSTTFIWHFTNAKRVALAMYHCLRASGSGKDVGKLMAQEILKSKRDAVWIK